MVLFTLLHRRWSCLMRAAIGGGTESGRKMEMGERGTGIRVTGDGEREVMCWPVPQPPVAEARAWVGIGTRADVVARWRMLG